MTNKVRVFNNNDYVLSHLFKGEMVTIEAKDYWRDKKGQVKDVDIFEANDFRGVYHAAPIDGDGKMVNDPKYYKILRFDPVGDSQGALSPTGIRCMAPGCDTYVNTPDELKEHSKAHDSLNKLVLPEQDEQLKKKRA